MALRFCKSLVVHHDNSHFPPFQVKKTYLPSVGHLFGWVWLPAPTGDTGRPVTPRALFCLPASSWQPTTSLFPPDPLQESGPHSRRRSSRIRTCTRGFPSTRPCRGVALPEPPPASQPGRQPEHLRLFVCVMMTNTFFILFFQRVVERLHHCPACAVTCAAPVRPPLRLCDCDFRSRRASVLSTPRPLRAAATLIVLYSFGILQPVFVSRLFNSHLLHAWLFFWSSVAAQVFYLGGLEDEVFTKPFETQPSWIIIYKLSEIHFWIILCVGGEMCSFIFYLLIVYPTGSYCWWIVDRFQSLSMISD